MTPGRPTPSPLTDDEATTQVLDVARGLNAALPLPHLFASFSFESCNDQGDPPYRGLLLVDFRVPYDQQTGFFDAITSTLINQGWSDGAGPGQHLYGQAVYKGDMVAHIDPGDHITNTLEIRGECRNMTDHHNDGKTNWINLTDRVTG